MLPLFKFTLFGYNQAISSYNLLIGIGIVMGLLVLQRTCKKLKIPKAQEDNLMIMIAVSLLAGFVSAILFDKIYHYNGIHNFLSSLTKYTGMTFEGGLVGGAIVFALIYRILNQGFTGIILMLNCVAPSIVMGHFWGRIGCFLGGCCFGKPTDSPIGIIFPDRSFASRIYGNGVKVIPVQLIEAAFLVMLFVLVSSLLLKYSFSCYLLLYGTFRFIIEYFRGDNRGVLFQTVFSPSQCISLLMLIIGGIILFKEVMAVRQEPIKRLI